MKFILNEELLHRLPTADASDLESVSARKKKAAEPEDEIDNATLESLIPVQLLPEEMEAFVKAFHPKRAAKGPQAFVDEARFLVEISAYVGAIFAGLRYGFGQLVHNYDGNVVALGDAVTKDIELSYKNATELEKKAKDYLMNMASGSHHIIRDSARFKGGKDILYVGLRGANVSPLLTADMAQTSAIPLLQSSYQYEANKTAYESEVAKAFVQTGLQIQRLFFGDQTAQLSASYARVMQQHLIGAKWTVIDELTKILMHGPLAKMGIPVLLPTFNGAMTDHAAARLKDYISVLALREPNHTIVLQKTRQKDTPDESLGICLEYQALQPDLRFSFAVNLPKNFCEYITQTKEEQIPLVPLNTWASVWSAAMLRPPKMRSAKGSSGDKAQGARVLIPERAPKYVLRPSVSDELIERRKKLGLYSEPGRVNEEGLYITYNGDLAFLNSSDVSATENAKSYEKIAEAALALSFDAGTPLAAGQRGSTGAVFDLASPHYAEKIAILKSDLGKYKGSAQAINWDLNTVLTVSVSDPDRLVGTKLIGANKPDDLNLATYLRSPFNRGMRDMFSRTRMIVDGRRSGVDQSSFNDVKQGLTQSSVFFNFAHFYNHLLKLKKVPALKELVDKAAVELKIKDLGDEGIVDFEVSPTDTTKTIYRQIIARDLSVMEAGEKTGQIIVALLGVVADQAAAKPNSNLARICIRDNTEFAEHDRYFDGMRSNVGEFGRLYAWLGGQVFLQALLAVIAVPRKDLLNVDDVEYDPANMDSGHPGYMNLVNEVMPMCTVFSKYVMPEVRDAIYTRADEQKEKESQFSDADLNLAGSKPVNPDGKGGMKLFPHQAEALAKLKAHPRIAILDIAPGGGKTTIGLSDIACLYSDGLVKRPFVFCPNRLVRNWIEDLHKSFNGWNAIPVTTETIALWGEERLTDMILKAPPNTVVIVGNSFISNKGKTQLVIGNAVDNVSNSVEFCKKFQPDYVLIDESHRIRNPRSAIHQGIKSIMQMSSVKYGRIGTGTLIQNVLSDVVGQSAVFNGQIFRTVDEFEEEHKGVVGFVNDKPIVDYLEETPLKARRRLAEFATVISFKRKEWAFMLPMPIETFITVKMEESGDTGHKLQLFYNAVLKETLEEAKNDPRLKKKKSDEDEDDEDDSASPEDHKITTNDGVSLDVSDEDDDSDSMDDLEEALQPYLQRLERILTDPFGDPELLDVAKGIFGDDFDENYVTPKVQKVIDRIKLHFTEVPWTKGTEYSAADMVDYNGKTYIFKSELAKGEGTERSDKAPDTDTENWKLQIRGKIFIACRYTRSVDAIYKALPAEYKEQAVRFHGEVEGKDDNLARFMNDPKTTIFIANEMGVSEGHNFQMASRFIRVEAPWAPGELDQTASRIFRPDVGGEYTRQSIFLDWIVCDETLEVAKMGRLISKMLKRAKFDELDNPKYYKNLNPQNLPIIKMSLDNIRELHSFNDLCAIPSAPGDIHTIHPHSYIGQYSFLVHEMSEEFREMRKTKPSIMLPVEATPMPEGSSVMDFVPWVANMKVEDKHGDGLRPLREALEDSEFELAREFKKNHKVLIGQYVRTEFGLGIITKVTTKRGGSVDEESPDADPNTDNEISKVRVQLVQGGNIEMLSASKVFLATKVTEQNKNKYNKKAPKITEADKKRTAKARAKAEEALERIRKREEAAKRRLATTAKRGTRTPPIEEPEVDIEEAPEKNVVLYPVVYNSFLALEAMEDLADSKELQRHGFTRFGNYAYLPVKTYQNFTAALDWIEANFTLAPKTVKLLDSLHDSFASGRGRKFGVDLAPVSEFPLFYRMRHQLTKVLNRRKPELKVYPVVISQNLVLVVDLSTNPAFRKYLSKVIKGMAGSNKFQEADGMDICFFNNKTSLIAKVKELRKAGFTITNYDELKEEVNKLTLKTAKLK